MKTAARYSVVRRLAMGLSVIALGFLCALPFHRSTTDDALAVGGMVEYPSALDEGVPLQVPGQQAVTSHPFSALRPLPVEEEPSMAATREKLAAPEPLLVASETPELPDQYRPLFRPEGSPRQSGSVMQPPGLNAQPTRRAVKQHTIHDGDTLESLARRYYSDPLRAADILNANRAVLSDPDLLPIGVEIVIPRQQTGDAVVESYADTEPATRKLVPLPALGSRRGR